MLSLSLRSAVLIFRASVSILCLCASVLNPITLCLWISVSRERRPPTLPYLLLCITYLLITYLLKFTTANYIFTKVYLSISCSVLHLCKSIHCSVKGASAADVESL